MKRFLSILLTIAMVLSLTVPAFAETTTITTTSGDGNSATQNVTASYTPTEAKWGTENDLTVGKGTLAQAFEAAKGSSAITYIQLQKSITATERYDVMGGVFTLDLNGCTISSSAPYDALLITGEGTNVTVIDSKENGAITATAGTSIVTRDSATLTIKSGTYTAPRSYASVNNGTSGILNIEGGVFNNGSVVLASGAGATTIKGGTFNTTYETIVYGVNAGTLDLSNYKGTTPLAEFVIYNHGEKQASDIKLPADYVLVDENDKSAAVTQLKTDYIYCIVPNTNVTIGAQAKWGESEDKLTSGGTLAEAFDAAKSNPETVTYIQLQNNVTATSTYNIYGGDFILDWNGCTLTNTAEGELAVLIDGATVTFTDDTQEKNGGIISKSFAVLVSQGTVTLKAGHYTGYSAVSIGATTGKVSNVTIEGGTYDTTSDISYAIDCTSAGANTLTINGGAFTTRGRASVNVTGGTVAINGGSFEAGELGCIYYTNRYNVKLDLSGYQAKNANDTALTDLTLYSDDAVTVGDSTIKLPENYGFYDSESKETVNELEAGTIYSIKFTGEAKWGESKEKLTSGGSLADALAAAKTDSKVKYIQLQNNVTVESTYNIMGGDFILDWNGYTLNDDHQNSYSVCVRGATVTFTDATQNKNGGIISKSVAILVRKGEVTLNAGNYEAEDYVVYNGMVDSDQSVVTINGGTYKATGYASYTILCTNIGTHTLTINGGTFKNTNGWASVWVGGTVKINGGSFEAGISGCINYENADAMLDLSGYQAKNANDTPLTALTVSSEEAVTVGDSTIKLPANYAFYQSGDTTKATVTTLENNTTYGIKFTGEAMWGESKDKLTSGGSLAQALAEAAKTDSKVKYIQLQNNVTATDYYGVSGGEFTLDLNGCTIIVSKDNAFYIYGESADVTFVDSSSTTAPTGKVVSKSDAIMLEQGKLTIASGNYEGECYAVSITPWMDTHHPEVIITGGNFTGTTATSGGAIGNSGGVLTIRGGSFSSAGDGAVYLSGAKGNTTITGGEFTITDANKAHIVYAGGKLDFSGYASADTALTALTLFSEKDVTVGDDTIKLPESHGFYLMTDTEKTVVNTLASDKTYGIKFTGEALWGASADSLTNSGTLAQAIIAAGEEDSTVKHIQLQKNVESEEGYSIYAGEFTLDLNGYSILASESAIRISHKETKLTIIDSSNAKTGTISSSVDNYMAVMAIDDATLTIKGGIYLSPVQSGDGGILNIKGGTFNGVLAALDAGKITITGGVFNKYENENAHISYYSGTGKLDLSDYAGTTSITDFVIRNITEKNIGDIVLPSGYALVNVNDKTEAAEELSYGYYCIVPASSLSTVPQAKWGTDKDHLTESGTFKKALKAAAENSTVKYIQIQKDLTAPEYGFAIDGGEFTLDLNGKTLTGVGQTVLYIDGANVTIEDIAGGGRLECESYYSNVAITLCGYTHEGRLTINGGTYYADTPIETLFNTETEINGGTFLTSYYGDHAVVNGWNMTINGGVFNAANGYSAVCAGETAQDTTICGGTFIRGSWGYFTYFNGTFDLSAYGGAPALGDITVYNGSDYAYDLGDEADPCPIVIPNAYSFSRDGVTAVTNLDEYSTYYIILSRYLLNEEEAIQAKWATSAEKIEDGESGTLAQALNAAAEDDTITYIQLQTDLTISDGYYIRKGKFTLDLNGHTVTSEVDATFYIAGENADVTFTDSATDGGGTLMCLGNNGAPITVVDGSVTVDGGTYDGYFAIYAYSGTTTVIKSGTFQAQDYGYVFYNGGTLTIEGGTFIGGERAVCTGWTSGSTTTILGGTFKDHEITFEYCGGTIDLSQYADSTAITAFDIHIGDWYAEGEEPQVGEEILLPKGYVLTMDGMTAETMLESYETYYIIPATKLSDAPQAKWGADAKYLTESGTLVEAFEAAAAENSNVGYIQLQMDLNVTRSYEISSGTFTFDLNGKTLTSDADFAFKINDKNANVTFTTSVDGGKVEKPSDSGSVIYLEAGKLTIDGGTYSGGGYTIDTYKNTTTIINKGTFTASEDASCPIYNDGTMTINGGTFKGGYSAVCVGEDSTSTVIKGGIFNRGALSNFEYWGGTLDFSQYSATNTISLSGYKLYFRAEDALDLSKGTIKLPEGYVFTTDGATAVSTLESPNFYTIIKTPTTTPATQAKWGADAEQLTNSGTLSEALAAAKADETIQYIQLQTDLPQTNGFRIKGGSFTLDLNGKKLATDAKHALVIDNATSHVTILDNAEGGKIEGTCYDGEAVWVKQGTLTIKSGSYCGDYALYVGTDGTAIIDGGTFTARNSKTTQYAAINFGYLTINGGTFDATNGYSAVCTVSDAVSTVIKGGTFTKGNSHLEYWGGTLDLSGYKGTTALTSLVVCNASETPVIVNDVTIKLPICYSLSADGKTIATRLKYGELYSIIAASRDEAAWGKDENSITHTGTLDEAFDAAEEENSTVGYIKLLNNVTSELAYDIYGGEFTLDLNGKTVTSSDYEAFYVTENAEVTFTDSGEGGSVVSTHEEYGCAIQVDGKVTITGGTYKGKIIGVSGGGSGGDEITITGGSFIGEEGYGVCSLNVLTIEGGDFSGGFAAVCASQLSNSVTIKAGTFGGTCSYGTFGYFSTDGKLDLTLYTGALTDFTVYNDEDSNGNVILPEGYVLVDSEKNVVTELAKTATYSITSTLPAITVADSENGTVTSDKAYAKQGTKITLTVSPESGYELDTLTVKETDTNNAVAFSKVKENQYTLSMPDCDITVTATFKRGTATITGLTIEVKDGETTVTPTDGVYTITPTSTVTITASGKFLANATDDNWVKYTSGASDEITQWTKNADGSRSYTCTGIEFVRSTTAFELQYSNDGGTTRLNSGIKVIYYVENPANITGVSITVDGTTYTTGNVVIKPDTQEILLTVTGTNLNNGTGNTSVYCGANSSVALIPQMGWDVSDDGTTATISLDVGAFVDCTTASQIRYTNDGGDTEINTGIYTIYQLPTSVEITWGSLHFTYSDEQTENGTEKGWTCEDGANAVTVKNTGTYAIHAEVAFKKNSETANITNVSGTFDITSATLVTYADKKFTLTLTGKPDGALSGATLGTVTVTIATPNE